MVPSDKGPLTQHPEGAKPLVITKMRHNFILTTNENVAPTSTSSMDVTAQEFRRLVAHELRCVDDSKSNNFEGFVGLDDPSVDDVEEVRWLQARLDEEVGPRAHVEDEDDDHDDIDWLLDHMSQYEDLERGIYVDDYEIDHHFNMIEEEIYSTDELDDYSGTAREGLVREILDDYSVSPIEHKAMIEHDFEGWAARFISSNMSLRRYSFLIERYASPVIDRVLGTVVMRVRQRFVAFGNELPDGNRVYMAGPREYSREEALIASDRLVLAKSKRPCARSRLPHAFEKLDGSNFSSRETNVVHNNFMFSALASGDRDVVKLHGITTYGDRVWMFPVRVGGKIFDKFLTRVQESPHEWRNLFTNGVLSRDLFRRERHLWSPVTMCGMEDVSTLDIVRLVGAIVAFYRAIVDRDVVGFATTCAMMADLFVYLKEMVPFQSLEDFLSIFPVREGEKIEEDGTILGEHLTDLFMAGESEPGPNLFSVLPKSLKLSPQIKALWSLSSILVASQWFSDLQIVKSLGNYVDWAAVATGGTLTLQVASATKELVRGMKAMIETGNPLDFFQPKSDLLFLDKCDKLLDPRNRRPKNAEGTAALIKEIDDLLLSVRYEVAYPELSRAKSSIKQFRDELVGKLQELAPRTVPFFVFLHGDPGAGKTTLIDSLLAIFRKRDGIEPFLGDTIHVNVHDKYPASAGLERAANAVVFNDICGDYTNFPQQDKMPLDILLQQLIDTSAFYFRAPDIESKGLLLTDVRYIIITSNVSSFAMIDDTLKLIRRTENGACWHVAFNNRKDRRPDDTCFKRMVPVSADRHFKFEMTSEVLEKRAFLNDCLKRLDEHNAREHLRLDRFVRSVVCECGMPETMHIVRGKLLKMFEHCSIGDAQEFEDYAAPLRGNILNGAGFVFLQGLTNYSLALLDAMFGENLRIRPEKTYLRRLGDSIFDAKFFMHSLAVPVRYKRFVFIPAYAIGAIDEEFGKRIVGKIIFKGIYERFCYAFIIFEFAEYTLLKGAPWQLRIPAALMHLYVMNLSLPWAIFVHLSWNVVPIALACYLNDIVADQCVEKDGGPRWDPIYCLSNPAKAALLDKRFKGLCTPEELAIDFSATISPLKSEKPEPLNLVKTFLNGRKISDVLQSASFVMATFVAIALMCGALLPFGLVIPIVIGLLGGAYRFKNWKGFEKRVERIVSRSVEEEFEIYIDNQFRDFRRSLSRAVATRLCYSKAKRFFENNKAPIAIFLASVGAYYTFKQLEKARDKIEVAGPVQSVILRTDVDPASMKTRVPEVKSEWLEYAAQRQWTQQRVAPTFLVPYTLGAGVDDLNRIADSACRKARFVRLGGYIDAFVIMLGPSYILFNHHFLYRDGKRADNFVLEVNGVETSYSYSEIFKSPTSEMAVVRNFADPSAAPLSKFLPSSDEATFCDVTILYKRGFESAPAYKTHFVEPVTGVRYDSWQWSGEVLLGDCGTPVISKGVNPCVVGFVTYGGIFGGKKSGGATLFSQKDLLAAVSFFGTEPVVMAAVDTVPCGPLSPKSEFLNVGSPYLRIIGTVGDKTRKFKSRIRRTRLYDEVAPLLKQEYSAPSAIRRLVDGEWKSAMIHQFKYINLVDESVFALKEAAMRGYLKDVLKAPFTGALHPLSLEQAIFGEPSIGVDRVPFSTSLGSRLRDQGMRDKRDLFEVDESTGRLRMKPQIAFEVDKLIAAWDEGILPAVDVSLTIKDEVRPKSKVEDCKVRLFAVVDFIYNIALRMHVMPLINFLMQNKFFSGIFGAMNAGSPQWEALKKYIQAVGLKTIDMDFSAYDTSHNQQAFEIVAIFFRELAKALGYTALEASRVYFALKMLSGQVAWYMNDVVFKIKGMPSGVIVTLIFNCIINLILMRMAFIILTGLAVEEFTKHVHAAVVGDDNLSGVSDEISQVYNVLTIFPLYKKFGYVATPASKGEVDVPYGPIEDQTFLKRKFVQDKSGYCFCPLDSDSIYKSLCFEMNTDNSHERFASCALNFQREFFLYGEERFLIEQKRLVELYGKHGLCIPELYDWSFLLGEFDRGEFTTWDM